MHDEYVRKFAETNSFAYVNFLLTSFALEVRNNFPCDELFEGSLKGGGVLNLEGEVVELFESIGDLLAIRADELGARFAAVDIL